MTQTLSREAIEKVKANWSQYLEAEQPALKELADQQVALCTMALSHADAYERGQRDMAAAAVKVAEKAFKPCPVGAGDGNTYTLEVSYFPQSIADQIRALSPGEWVAVPAPRPIGPEQKDGRLILASSVNHDTRAVVGWNADESCWTDVGGENAAATLMVGEGYFTHFIPLDAIPRALIAAAQE